MGRRSSGALIGVLALLLTGCYSGGGPDSPERVCAEFWSYTDEVSLAGDYDDELENLVPRMGRIASTASRDPEFRGLAEAVITLQEVGVDSPTSSAAIAEFDARWSEAIATCFPELIVW